jgi:hypothetical protein
MRDNHHVTALAPPDTILSGQRVGALKREWEIPLTFL